MRVRQQRSTTRRSARQTDAALPVHAQTIDNLQRRMGVLVQIRDLPEPVHRTLKARAAASGTSLSEYLRALLAREAARPTPAELAERAAARGSVSPEPSERSVRRLRESGE